MFKKKYVVILKIVHNFLVYFSKKDQKRFGPKRVSYGFDRAGKTAQDAHKRTSEKYAHST
jgi:hypothetical protein